MVTFGRKITSSPLPKSFRADAARRIYKRGSLPPGSDRVQIRQVLMEIRGCKDRSSRTQLYCLTELSSEAYPLRHRSNPKHTRTLDLRVCLTNPEAWKSIMGSFRWLTSATRVGPGTVGQINKIANGEITIWTGAEVFVRCIKRLLLSFSGGGMRVPVRSYSLAPCDYLSEALASRMNELIVVYLTGCLATNRVYNNSTYFTR
jgi:hypothetical protein